MNLGKYFCTVEIKLSPSTPLYTRLVNKEWLGDAVEMRLSISKISLGGVIVSLISILFPL